MGYIIVNARVAMNLWSKQTLSSGFALRLGSFTAINPWPLCYNYNIFLQDRRDESNCKATLVTNKLDWGRRWEEGPFHHEDHGALRVPRPPAAYHSDQC